MRKVLGLLLLLAAPATADEVVLRNGSVFSGLVVDHGDRVSVQMDYGTMTFRKIDIREVRRTEDPLRDLEKKVGAAVTSKQMFETALWARDQGLVGRSNDLLEKVIQIEPDHEAARRLLGYERHEGAWLRGDDLRVARGYIRHQGRWLKKDTVEQLLAQEAAEAIELERQKTLRAEAANAREIELQKVAVERERLEVEREWIRKSRWWSQGNTWGSAVLVPAAGFCGPPAHPGYGPGRLLPPAADRPYPSWSHSPITPPPGAPPIAPVPVPVPPPGGPSGGLRAR